MPRPARDTLLDPTRSCDCTLYREADNPNDEELDLGDGRVLLLGPHALPAEWDAQRRARYCDDAEPEALFQAWIEPLREGAFQPRIGDFLAVTTAAGEVQMYSLHDLPEGTEGPWVLLREDEE